MNLIKRIQGTEERLRIKLSRKEPNKIRLAVKRNLRLHAENYIKLESDESKITEDKAAFEFVSCVYSGNLSAIKRCWRLYKRLKRIYIARED